MDLIGCPICDFAKKKGFMSLMPYMCNADHYSAQAVHGKLIHSHTVATGVDT